MILSEYTNLITSQYNDCPKFREWLETLLTPFIDTQNLANELYTYFDLETAVGKQLDMLGQIVGASRLLPFQPVDENDEPLDALLNDDNYRFLIKSQILRNTWDGTNQNIYDMWQTLNPDVPLSIKDNQNMTVNAIFIGYVNDIEKQMIEHDMIVPRAQGVKMEYSFSTPPLFAHDQDTDYYKGYDQGNWANLGGL